MPGGFFDKRVKILVITVVYVFSPLSGGELGMMVQPKKNFSLRWKKAESNKIAEGIPVSRS